MRPRSRTPAAQTRGRTLSSSLSARCPSADSTSGDLARRSAHAPCARARGWGKRRTAYHLLCRPCLEPGACRSRRSSLARPLSFAEAKRNSRSAQPLAQQRIQSSKEREKRFALGSGFTLELCRESHPEKLYSMNVPGFPRTHVDLHRLQGFLTPSDQAETLRALVAPARSRAHSVRPPPQS